MSIYCSLDDIHITGGKKMLASEFRLLWYGTNNLKWEVCVVHVCMCIIYTTCIPI